VLRDLFFTADKKQREGQANCLKLAISAIRAATVKCLSLLFVRKTLRRAGGWGIPGSDTSTLQVARGQACELHSFGCKARSATFPF
jgi:hypothetical protein